MHTAQQAKGKFCLAFFVSLLSESTGQGMVIFTTP
jgi:hypothetical protein